jgi:hypothetical protein
MTPQEIERFEKAAMLVDKAATTFQQTVSNLFTRLEDALGHAEQIVDRARSYANEIAGEQLPKLRSIAGMLQETAGTYATASHRMNDAAEKMSSAAYRMSER